MDLWGITDSGKVRSVNQDVFRILTDHEKSVSILVVCDGMGGANAGNIASELAADVFASLVDSQIKQLDESAVLDNIADIAADAVEAANRTVFDKSLFNPEYSGMGTTLTALVSTSFGEIVVNIGDSRAYHVTSNGVTQISKDHSVVQDMIDRGEITRSEANSHPRKNLITRAVGAEMYIESDIFMQIVDKGDFVLLCTDGLSNLVTEEELFEVLQKSDTVRQACEDLVEMALLRGAPDNVTVAVFRK